MKDHFSQAIFVGICVFIMGIFLVLVAYQLQMDPIALCIVYAASVISGTLVYFKESK